MTEYSGPVEGEQTEAREQPHLISQRAADITPRHIDFLWAGRLARGKHTAFAGEPGDGKSQLSVYVAATLSRGGEWPCNEGRAPLGNVIIFNAEDGADDTIVPRLIAAGADMERVHIVSAVLLQDGKGRRAFNLQADLALLEKKICEIGDVALVIIDPISSYMGKVDSHKNSEVRGALEPLSEMAERMRVTVLSITHFSKAGSGTTNKALHRFIGSIAFVGAPRAAFAVIEDADNEGRMLLLHAKNNMAPKPQGLAYRLLQTIVSGDIVASYVHWEDTPVTISADQALGQAQDKNTGSRTMKEEATDFLRDILRQGAVPVEDVQQAARKAGIAPKPLRVAREELKVKPWHKGFGPDVVWFWSLPNGSLDALAPLDAQPRDWAPKDPEGIYGATEAPQCDNMATAGNGHRGADVTASAKSSLNPEMRDGDPRDCGPMPEHLIRRAPLDRPVCAVCKKPDPPPNQVAVDGLPVWLHPDCEGEHLRRLDAKSHQGNRKQPDAVAEVPRQAEPRRSVADVIDTPDPGTQNPGYSDQAMAIFEARYPDYVEDGRRFLERWGERAEAYGWSPDDEVKLITGLLPGYEVSGLTGAQASIRNPKTGKVNIVYRDALRWRP